MRDHKIKLYIAKSSADRVEAKRWIEKARVAGFDVYDWTSDPGWANPTEENRAIGADHDIDAVLNASIVWWQLDDNKSEGAALEFGAAIGQKLDSNGFKTLVVSGARSVDKSAFFTLHPVIAWRCETHDEAWAHILSIVNIN